MTETILTVFSETRCICRWWHGIVVTKLLCAWLDQYRDEWLSAGR